MKTWFRCLWVLKAYSNSAPDCVDVSCSDLFAHLLSSLDWRLPEDWIPVWSTFKKFILIKYWIGVYTEYKDTYKICIRCKEQQYNEHLWTHLPFVSCNPVIPSAPITQPGAIIPGVSVCLWMIECLNEQVTWVWFSLWITLQCFPPLYSLTVLTQRQWGMCGNAKCVLGHGLVAFFFFFFWPHYGHVGS